MAAARRRTPSPPHRDSGSASRRFRQVDGYRALREWRRYEGTGQRDLYRELRERFLCRHAALAGWALDIGSGPGRFLPFIGREETRRVAFDISREMLGLLPAAWHAAGAPGPVPHRVLGDALHPPFEGARWAEVAVLGNALGFAAADADKLLERSMELVAADGTLVVEVAPGPGERARYLTRLPAPSVARLLSAPLRAVLGRLDREGFRAELPRHAATGSFRRFSAREVHHRLTREGWEVTETVAVAPALGPDPVRTDAVRKDPRAWSHLLELEEEVGRRPERWERAAALLVAARRPSVMRMIK